MTDREPSCLPSRVRDTVSRPPGRMRNPLHPKRDSPLPGRRALRTRTRFPAGSESASRQRLRHRASGNRILLASMQIALHIDIAFHAIPVAAHISATAAAPGDRCPQAVNNFNPIRQRVYFIRSSRSLQVRTRGGLRFLIRKTAVAPHRNRFAQSLKR